MIYNRSNINGRNYMSNYMSMQKDSKLTLPIAKSLQRPILIKLKHRKLREIVISNTVSLPKTKLNNKFIIIVIDYYSKLACIKTISSISRMYKEIFYEKSYSKFAHLSRTFLG